MESGFIPGYLLGYAVLMLPVMALMVVYAAAGAVWLAVEWAVKRVRDRSVSGP